MLFMYLFHCEQFVTSLYVCVGAKQFHSQNTISILIKRNTI